MPTHPGQGPPGLCLGLLFFYFQKEEKEERRRERETSTCEKNMDQLPLACLPLGTWPTAQACALTGNLTGDLAVCRPMLNPLSHTIQGSGLDF